ncbi:hypothetical protein MRB53_021438 [Persea americana]|uniref:Uncharacterized protein n=1 Tax=Persea americana TaxID=3435 RepID=A0ACC2L4M3_PERAE|nr:hypothetical protein MRB53_021438 [Persea americana]
MWKNSTISGEAAQEGQSGGMVDVMLMTSKVGEGQRGTQLDARVPKHLGLAIGFEEESKCESDSFSFFSSPLHHLS